MANDMAKLIAGYVNEPDDLQKLYSDAKEINFMFEPIEWFKQNIKTQIYNKKTTFTISVNNRDGYHIQFDMKYMLNPNYKKYTIECRNYNKIMKEKIYLVRNTRYKSMIDYARKLKMCIYVNNNASMIFDWSEWSEWSEWSNEQNE